MTLDELSDKLDRVSGQGYVRKARCPAHDDQVASLSLKEVEDGKILLNCFAGCNPKAIALALGLSMRDLCGDKKRAGKEVARYAYTDRDGVVLYEKVRYEPKDFRFTPSGYRGDRVPYRLPEIIEAQGRRVIWVEGEKDADALHSLGLVATTAGGVNDWRPEMAQWFVGRSVVVIPDNDDPGRGHANQVASALSAVAKDVAIWEPTGLEPKQDVSDWIDGRTKGDLVEALLSAKPFTSSALQTFDTVSTTEPDWLWFPRIARGAITMVFGEAGLGKSTIMLDVLARLSRGASMPNSVDPQSVTKSVIVGIEGPVERTRGVLESAGANLKNVALVARNRMPEPDKSPLEQIEHLAAEMKRFGAGVLLVDNVTEAFVSDTDSSNEYSVRTAMRKITAFAEGNNVAVVMIAHPKKGASFGSVKEAITGSQALTNLPRTTLFVAPVYEHGEKTAARAVAVAKSNLYEAEQVNTLTFQLRSEEIAYRDGHSVTTAPRVEWKGVIYQDAQQLLDAMRPKKQEATAPTAVEPPMLVAAKSWLAGFVRTMPANGMTWEEIREAADGRVTEGALRKVRSQHLRASGQAGNVRWFPLEAEATVEVAAVAPAEPEPAQPASERMERFMASESTEAFLRRKAGEEPLDNTTQEVV